MKGLLNLDNWDHPLVFLVFLALAFIPVLFATYAVAGRVGLPLPSLQGAGC